MDEHIQLFIVFMKTKSLRLSIIVPVYNVERYLKSCIESLLCQDIEKSEYEIILVNDGSTDGSFDICLEQSRIHENVMLVSQSNRGLSEARNTGVNKAEGVYVSFVDSDDQLFPNVLGIMLDAAERNNLDVVESRMIVQNSDGHEYLDFVQPFSSNSIYTGEQVLLRGVHIGSVCTNMYRREFLDSNNLRFTAGIYHEDVEFNLRMYALAKRLMFLDVVTYYYRYNPTSIDREKTQKKIVHSYRSEFRIAKNIKEFADTSSISLDLRRFYNQHENSAIVSCLISLVRRRDVEKKTKIELLEELKKAGLWPIQGRTLSWKTTVLIPLLNCNLLPRLL